MIEKISKDDLTGIVMKIDCMSYMIQEMQDDFFYLYDPQNEEGKKGIVWEFERNRAKAEVISCCISDIQQELNNLGIKPYHN